MVCGFLVFVEWLLFKFLLGYCRYGFGDFCGVCCCVWDLIVCLLNVFADEEVCFNSIDAVLFIVFVLLRLFALVLLFMIDCCLLL